MAPAFKGLNLARMTGTKQVNSIATGAVKCQLLTR